MVDPVLATTLPAAEFTADAASVLQSSLATATGSAGDVASHVLLQEGTTNGTATTGTTVATGGGESGGLLDFSWLEGLVETATGWAGLAIIAVYSFLIAFVLPLPSEVVLAAPLDLGLPYWAKVGLIMLVSGAGKAAGSVFAFHIGQEAKESGPVISYLRRSRFDVVEWSENKTVEIARTYGYVGLAMALTVPGFPDTLSIYAFSVLEEDYLKFAAATFAGSVGRLAVWAAGAQALFALI